MLCQVNRANYMMTKTEPKISVRDRPSVIFAHCGGHTLTCRSRCKCNCLNKPTQTQIKISLRDLCIIKVTHEMVHNDDAGALLGSITRN